MVLRFNGMVYLRPQEVSEVVFKVCWCVAYGSIRVKGVLGAQRSQDGKVNTVQ